jgi:hypothetical protein
VGLFPLAALEAAEEKQAAPRYTNVDLDRIAPLRAETGATSTPVSQPAPFVDDRPARERTEAHWRREAERHHTRMAALKRKADDLRLRLEDLRQKAEEQRRKSLQGRNGAASQRQVSDRPVRSAEARLRAVLEQMREADSAFEDRARIAGALPGWIR